MLSLNKFEKDLEVGKESEKRVLEIIKNKYPMAFLIDGYCKSYDIFIPELSAGVEVKKDFKSKYTGNIVVEIAMNNKLSALSTTLAKYWVFVVPDKLIWMKPDSIKNCIIQNNLDMKTFIGNGDTVEKDAYLIRRELLEKYAINKI